MKYFFVITTLLLITTTQHAFGCSDGPQPPAVKIVDTKAKPSCINLSESFIQIKPNEPVKYGFGCISHYASALALKSSCDKNVVIRTIDITTEKTTRHSLSMNEAMQNKNAFSLNDSIYLFHKNGAACKASDISSLLNLFQKFFSFDKEPEKSRAYCSSIELQPNATAKIVIPHNSQFAISGVIGTEPLLATGRLIDPDDPDQALEYFRAELETDKNARTNLMALYRRKKDYKEFYNILTQIAEEGEYSAQASLGSAYAEGKEIEKDCEKSKKWLSAAIVSVDKKVIEEQPTQYRIAEFRRDSILRELASTLAFKCGDDFRSAINLLRRINEESFFSEKLHEAEAGNTRAQKTIQQMYRNRANAFQSLADFWLKLATGRKDITWKNAAELELSAKEHQLALHTANKAELMKFSEGGLAVMSRLDDENLKYLVAAVDGDIHAQYKLSRALFAAAVKCYEEFYFWGTQLQSEDDASFYPPNYPVNFLTPDRIGELLKRAKNRKK